MKIIIKAWVFFLTLFLSFSLIMNTTNAMNNVPIYFFYDQACVHCYEEGLFLDEIEETYDYVTVYRFEITTSTENSVLFNEMKVVFNQESSLTPFTIIGGIALSGYNDQTKSDIETMVEYYSENNMIDVLTIYQNGDPILAEYVLNITDYRNSFITLPLIGEVDLEVFSLSLGAIIIGFVDGFNPCAMWVLLFLITLLIKEKNRKKMWVLGFTFLFASALMYFLIMSAWLNIAIQVSAVVWIRTIIGLFAVGFGGYHLYKFFKGLHKKDIGCEVTTGTQKLKILNKVKKVVLEKNLLFALIGIVTLAISVNLVELACSAGLPLLYTQILAYHSLAPLTYYGYILLYILFFLIDDLLIFTIAMFTLQATGISNKYSKISTVVGGIIMLVIGILLIFFPNIIMFNI